nr:MAG: ORF1 [Torque teno midi virus]
MPFWWNRRRKPWFGRWRYRKRYYKPKRRRRRRRIPRKRNRRATRRRYKRRRKVRRKLKRISIKQWQPDSITKCTIKGHSCLVLGANGRQMYCYTNVRDQYTIPKAPGGGGFGCELINLKWLYSEYTSHNNIWTKTNEYKELCRYTGCTITVYRHPYVDFILVYHLQGPFLLTKYTYPELQPQNALLARHKKIILSQKNAPNSKLRVKIKIKPPKLMSTKWFFQKEFCDHTLVQLCATACSLSYPRIQPNGQNEIITLYALNTAFYHNSDWAQAKDQPYKNITTQTYPLWFTHSIKGITSPYKYDPTTFGTGKESYTKSVSYTQGLFSPQVLTATQVKAGATFETAQLIAQLPVIVLRYNPNTDDGHGNQVYLTSTMKGSFDKPQINNDYRFDNVPLWMALFGYKDFLLKSSNDKGLFLYHMIVVKSTALHPISQTTEQVYYPLIDIDFAFGRLPYDEYITTNMKSKWYPSGETQETALNNIVNTGPYVPTFNNITNSTWELDYFYKFFFKWGGSQTTDPIAEDPCTKGTFPTLSTIQKTIQIKNPEKITPESYLHQWDFRRGIATATALKRMSENIETDTSFEFDEAETPKKKRKVSKEMPYKTQEEEEITNCLLSLCEENTCQEQTQDLQQLIHQQQQHQQHLKQNILKLLTHLKQGQRKLQLQTGLLE